MATKVAKAPKPPKAPKPAKKSSSGGGMKQLLLQKGERIGFIAAAALLVVFLSLGVIVAANSDSTSQITGKIGSTIQSANQKMTAQGAPPPPIDPVAYMEPKLLDIKFTEYATRNSFFNEADIHNPKRISPKVLPATDAMVEFVMGTVPAMDTIVDPANGKTMVAVLKNRPPTQADLVKVKSLTSRRKTQQKAARPPVVVPGMNQPGGAPGAPGVPGGLPGGGLPGGLPGGGLPGGGLPGGAGPRGGLGGLGGGDAMGGNARTQELQIEYVDIESKEFEKALPAPALMTLRMAVVTGFIPYKKQVEEYVRALRAYSWYDLGNENLPYYNGLVVERQKIGIVDGKEVTEDWQPLDIKDSFADLYARALDWEPNDMMSWEQLRDASQEMRDLNVYFSRLVPDYYHRLVLPRPRLMSGKYAPITLPSAIDALKELKRLGDVKPLKSPRQQKFDKELDPFGDPNIGRTGGMGGPGGDAAMPGGAPSRGEGGFPGGGGRPAPPGGGRGPFPPGAPGGPPEMDNRFGGPGLPGGPGQAPAVPEDAWMFRFIDVTTEPGYAYRYRVKVKVHNPNFRRDARELAISDLAKVEELESPWYVVKDLARSPQDEFIYAASNEPRGNPPKVTEKVPTGSSANETWLQVHKWFRDIRPRNATRSEPIGDWVIADIHAVRGQYLSDTSKIELPTWSMTQSKFLFRDTPPPPQRNVRRTAKEKRSWDIEFSPRLNGREVLVVDFEGGQGQHIANSKGKPVEDTVSMDILLMTEDGKLRLARSAVDLANKERKDRVDYWTTWLEQIETATTAAIQLGGNPFGGGRGDAGPGGPGGDR